MELFALMVAGDVVRDRIERSLARDAPRKPTPKQGRPRKARVRSSSAAALRSLAERLEPSPS
jgi:hypothetical protein